MISGGTIVKNNKLIYSPNGIPIGEPLKLADGTIALRIKRGEVIDDVRLDYLMLKTCEKLKKE